jgi:hypothetical protein
MMHITRLVVLVLVLQFSAGALSMEKPSANQAALLPDAHAGWETSGDDHLYDRETLYHYIDGGAELYLSFGFKTALSRTYARSGQPNIIVDLFDMSTSKDAFGVFSLSRETVDRSLGQGSQYTEGLLLFWKNNYYVSILAETETDESKNAVFAIAGHIESAIPDEGPLPDILSLLPGESLVEESIRYFRHHIWLNSQYYIADENILHIGDETHAVLARYGKPGKRPVLLLVAYPGGEAAREAYDDFAKHYLPELSGQVAVRVEDGTWTGCELSQELIAIVFNAPSRDGAVGLLDEVRKRWNQREEKQ